MSWCHSSGAISSSHTQTMIVCNACIASFPPCWMYSGQMPHGPGALSDFIMFIALYASMIVGGGINVSMGVSGADALTSECKAFRGGSEDPFHKVLMVIKYNCTINITITTTATTTDHCYWYYHYLSSFFHQQPHKHETLLILTVMVTSHNITAHSYTSKDILFLLRLREWTL